MAAVGGYARPAPVGMKSDRPSQLLVMLDGIAAAARLERPESGLSLEQQWAAARVINERLLQAKNAGATVAELAGALGVDVGRVQDRLRQAQADAAVLP